jgi:4-aminobutyrate aminotransferase/(S)-3-amino-2-methylpropionate transaminase
MSVSEFNASPAPPDPAAGLQHAERLRAARDKYVARGMTSASSTFAVRADGVWLTDVEGREYLDFATGISVLNVGHRHPTVQAAIRRQLDMLVHSGGPVMMPTGYIELAQRLCEITPGDFDKKALLVNSGAEAVENAVKIVRQATDRPVIFSFQSSFHGRTLLTMTMSGKMHPYRQRFGPYANAVYRLPYPDPYRRPPEFSIPQWTDYCLAAFEAALVTEAPADQVAAVIIEPVQGEGGFIVPPVDFLPRLAEGCRRHNIPLIVDEIQTGLGRTGKMFAVEHSGVEPDLILLAKSLGGGLPLAAVVGRSELMDATEPGGLGGTFGGNPVACAAALAVIDVIRDEDLCARSAHIGDVMLARARSWQQRHEGIGDVRGLGAMVAMELVADRETKEPAAGKATEVVTAAHDLGLLVLKAGLHDNVVRVLAPLITSDADLAAGLDILEHALTQTFAGG